MGESSLSREVGIEIRNRPFLPIFINGQGPYWFLLDTGALSSMLSNEVAQTLRLKREDVPNRETYASVVELSIGGIEWRHLICVDDLSRISKLVGRSVDGMLGYFFLKDVKVTIDYPEETVFVEARKGLEETLNLPAQELIKLQVQELQELTDLLKEPRSAPDQGLPDYSKEHGEENGPRNPYEVPIQIRTAYAIVPVSVNGEGPYQFALDTGSSKCVISPELAEALQLKRGKSGTSRVIIGEKKHYLSCVKTLVVGAAQSSDLEVSVKDCSFISERVRGRVDGLLGHSFLKERSVTVNYPERILILQ